MPIDIASMDAATKLAFAQAVGSVKLAGGIIAAPTTSIVIPVPTGFGSFRLEASSFKGAANATPTDSLSLAIEVSVDDGATFIGTGSAAFDEYINFATTGNLPLNGTITNAQVACGTDLSVDIGGYNPAIWPTDLPGASLFANLTPGSSSEFFSITSDCSFYSNGNSGAGYSYVRTFGTLNAESTNFDASWRARITHVCLQFYDSAWNDSKITQGSYSFFGNG